MSIKVMSMIWDRLDVAGGELNLALALGDRCDDSGGSLYPSVAMLASRTRQTERHVRRQLKRFQAMGWLHVIAAGGIRGGRRMTNRYQINPLWLTGVILSGVPELTPDKMSGVEGKTDICGAQPLTFKTVTPDAHVSLSVMIHHDPKSAESRASPTGSLPARKGRRRTEPQMPPLDARLASAREMLAVSPDFPLDRLATMYSLTLEQAEGLTAPAAEYSAR